jgi:hypothetical protein
MCDPMDFLDGMARAAQVIKGRLNVGVIDRFLENLAIRLEAGDPDWFGLSHHSTNRPLKGFAVYAAVNFYE